jgi:hypothetical protein
MTLEQMALFDMEPAPGAAPAPPPAAADPVSAGRKLLARQGKQLTDGWHPLSGGRLHPDAAPADDRAAPGLRCGSCRYRELIYGGQNAYPKCTVGAKRTADGHPLSGPRITHGAATDVRAWWPACRDYEPRADDSAVAR